MTGFTWVDGPFGGTPQTAANLNAAMGVSDAAIAAQINNGASATATALNATYVRFTDLAGNPISVRHVTIKVDTSTWDIADIVAEP